MVVEVGSARYPEPQHEGESDAIFAGLVSSRSPSYLPSMWDNLDRAEVLHEATLRKLGHRSPVGHWRGRQSDVDDPDRCRWRNHQPGHETEHGLGSDKSAVWKVPRVRIESVDAEASVGEGEASPTTPLLTLSSCPAPTTMASLSDIGPGLAGGEQLTVEDRHRWPHRVMTAHGFHSWRVRLGSGIRRPLAARQSASPGWTAIRRRRAIQQAPWTVTPPRGILRGARGGATAEGSGWNGAD
jgi:hypothetical protein